MITGIVRGLAGGVRDGASSGEVPGPDDPLLRRTVAH